MRLYSNLDSLGGYRPRIEVSAGSAVTNEHYLNLGFLSITLSEEELAELERAIAVYRAGPLLTDHSEEQP